MKYRYREAHEMKDSGVEWLGMIPREWEVSKLKYKSQIITGNTPLTSVKEYYENGFIDWVKPNNILENFTLLEAEQKLSNLGLKQARIVSENSTVVCCIGTIGKTAITNKNITTNQQINSICFKAMNKKYGFFQIIATNDEHKKRANTVVVSILNKENQLQIPIVVPREIEQQKIADFLDKKCSQYDSVIEKKEALITKLEEAKKSLISEVVTGKVKVIEKAEGSYEVIKREAHEMKDSGIEWLGMIPREWEVKKVKYCFNFYRGLPITKLDLKNEGISCLNYGEIHSKYPFIVNSNDNNLQKVSEEYLRTNQNSLLKYGDLVFADTSEDLKGSGNFTFIDGEENIFAGYHTIIMRCKMKYLEKYLAYLFESINIRKQIQAKVKGVKVYSITQNILKEIDILISEDEVNITDFLDQKCFQFDSVIEKQKQLIEKLKSAKQSLISEAVTGKIEVLQE